MLRACPEIPQGSMLSLFLFPFNTKSLAENSQLFKDLFCLFVFDVPGLVWITGFDQNRIDPIAWGSVTMTTDWTWIAFLIGYSACQCGESDAKYGNER